MRVGQRASVITAMLVATSTVAACSGSSESTGPGGRTSDKPSPSSTSAPAALSKVDAKVKVGGSPCGITDAAGSIWVSDADKSRLLRIDPKTQRVQTVAKLDPAPCEITVAYGSLWVVTQSGHVDRVDPKDGSVIARVPVGNTSYQAVATPGAVWVSNRNDGTLTEIDPETNRVVNTVNVGNVQPGGMAYAAGALWIGDDTSGEKDVLRMDPKTRALTHVTVGDRPAYMTGLGDAVWVSNQQVGSVSHLDATTGKVVATLDVGINPVNLKARGTDEVWVPDDIGNQVIRIDATGNQIIERVPTVGGPAVLRAVGDDVWVTMFEAGEVWRIHVLD